MTLLLEIKFTSCFTAPIVKAAYPAYGAYGYAPAAYHAPIAGKIF